MDTQEIGLLCMMCEGLSVEMMGVPGSLRAIIIVETGKLISRMASATRTSFSVNCYIHHDVTTSPEGLHHHYYTPN